MISTLIAFALMAGGNELVCPIMGEAANMAGPKVEYNGAMFAFCCGGCGTGSTSVSRASGATSFPLPA